MSPWPKPRRGFTLVELLVVVLIIGILAAIALPRLLGQRTRAKNVAAQAAVRNALLAARSYYTQNSESYIGLGASQLQGYESSLSGSEPLDTQTPGPSANPQSIWIGNGLTGTNPNTTGAGDPNGGNTVVLCSISKGDSTYCLRDVDGTTTYLQATNVAVSVMASGSLYSSSWSSKSYNAAVATTSGLVNYWRLEENSGTSASDSKSGSNGTFNAAPTWSTTTPTASSSRSAQLNGTTYFDVAPYTYTPSGSIEMWGRRTETATTVTWYMGDWTNDRRMQGINRNNCILQFTNGDFGLCNAFEIFDTNWHHLVFTWETSGADALAASYLDGVRIGGAFTFSNRTFNAGVSAGGIRFGACNSFVACGQMYGLIGYLDEVAVYNRALTAAEVASHYAAR